MKKLLILSVLVSTNLYASNWVSKTQLLNGSNEAFTFQQDCEKVKGEECIDIGNYPSSVFSELDVLVDDLSSPKFSKNEVVACESQADCDLIHLTKNCEDQEEISIKNYDLLEVYCSKQIGFNKKEEKKVMPDPVKVLTWENQKIVDAQAAQMEANLKIALNKIECGKRVIALLVLRNAPKQLTTTQIAQMTQTYAGIKGLLETASLVTAKEQIIAVVADGVIITEADKTALANETQKCIDL